MYVPEIKLAMSANMGQRRSMMVSEFDHVVVLPTSVIRPMGLGCGVGCGQQQLARPETKGTGRAKVDHVRWGGNDSVRLHGT